MFQLRRIRRFLGLRQADVAAATGIAVGRLAAAENGRQQLRPVELRAVEEYLKARLRMANAEEAAANTLAS